VSIPSTSSDGGWATVDLDSATTVSGAAKSPEDTNNGEDWQDVVPDAEFESSTMERNRWTAVADFKGTVEPRDAPYGHVGAYFRGQDVTWDTDNQTRFGTILFGDDEYDEGDCSDEPCAALQFTGNEIGSNPTSGKTELRYFPIDEFPWDESSHVFRVQVEEMEVKVSRVEWRYIWYAHIYDLTDDDHLIESYGPIWDYTITGTYGIEIPSLSGSRVAFGYSFGESGEVKFDVVGTQFWDC
jgi:hypothetical protein